MPIREFGKTIHVDQVISTPDDMVPAMPARMKDIAKDLGVSIVTVSKVLRGHEDISEPTRKKVLQRVKDLNYTPNLMARSLVTGRSSLIGLLVPDLLHPFFAEVAKSISFALRQSSHYVILSSSEEDPELEIREMEQLQAHRLGALVIASSQSTPERFRKIQEQGIPLILIDRDFPRFASHYVGIDHHAVGVLATEHLIHSGCKRIAHIRGRENAPGTKRFEGYRDTMLKHHKRFSEEDIVLPRTVDVESRQAGFDAMNRLLDKRIPDGVFCYNDPLAIGAMDAILARGLRIPEDISLVGCGNHHYNDSLRIPLTSVDQHSKAMGEKIAKLLMHVLKKKHAPNRKIILKPNLVIRSSTRPI